MHATNWALVADALSDVGISIDSSISPRPVGGGDISAAWRLQSTDGPLFLKTGKASAFEMFDAEACGLGELAAANAVRVPKVRAVRNYGEGAFIALEYDIITVEAEVIALLRTGLFCYNPLTASEPS